MRQLLSLYIFLRLDLGARWVRECRGFFLFYKILVMAWLCVSVGQASKAQVQAHELQIVIHAFTAEYKEELAKENAKLLINHPPAPGATDFWWNLDVVRASYSTSLEAGVRIHYVFVMGGYARMQGMTVDGLVATICHELGHGLAGPPFKDGQDGGAKISVEGQADYFAYRSCLPRMFKRLAAMKSYSAFAQAEKICAVAQGAKVMDKTQLDFCLRAVHTLEVEKSFFWQSNQTAVDVFASDAGVAQKTDLRPDYYPSPQCRLDTMLAGIIQRPRPACWFKE